MKIDTSAKSRGKYGGGTELEPNAGAEVCYTETIFGEMVVTGVRVHASKPSNSVQMRAEHLRLLFDFSDLNA